MRQPKVASPGKMRGKISTTFLNHRYYSTTVDSENNPHDWNRSVNWPLSISKNERDEALACTTNSPLVICFKNVTAQSEGLSIPSF